MVINADMTLFNRVTNDKGEESYLITHFYGVSWTNRITANVRIQGLMHDLSASVRIFTQETKISGDKKYVSTEQELTEDTFTYRVGDYIYKGIVDSFDLQLTDYNLVQIQGVINNTSERTSQHMRHWRLLG